MPPWTTRFSASHRISSREPPKAATAIPPPSTLPSTVMSGVTPKRCWAPPGARRKPVITSSKITSAPAARVWSRPAARGTRVAARAPHPTRGRLRRSPPPAGRRHSAIASSRASGSFQGTVQSDAITPAGIPAESGRAGRDADAGPAPRSEVVGPAVVVALELDHELASRRRAGEPDRRLRRLGARVREPELLDPGDELRDELGRPPRRAGAGRRCASRAARPSPRLPPRRRPARDRTG